ncbi:alkene reductase [Sulfuriferula nivalis]|uniref:Alkene reductase n=1 Tax=Sulfuriferula nivalis TaxID=2675298 RepID=A0A809RF17_9PROT|nr:alkene reductase [Sulfuriferula nivalis]BBP00226.1 alkene reductase [Sulfuriferula nivalis]
MTTNVFTPIKLGRYTLTNRIVMAPLTRCRADENNAPRAMNVEYYRQRATAGLIISEGSQITAKAVGYLGTPGIYSDAQIAGWQQVTAAVHSRGGRIFLQLWHCGRVSHPSMLPDNMQPVAPSAIRAEGHAHTMEGVQAFVTPHELTTAEIAVVVAEFSQAAQNALQAGFDGVEIHGANGYLIDQFIRDGSNQRTDEYGGSLANRARFLLEITQAVVNVWGADRVGVRLSPINPFNDMSDSNPQATFDYVAQALSPFQLAYLHVTEWAGHDASQPKPAFDFAQLRAAYQGTYMTNGGYTLDKANAAISSGTADLVAFGSLYIANPDLAERFAQNAPLNTPDASTFYGGNEAGYTDYPSLTLAA